MSPKSDEQMSDEQVLHNLNKVTYTFAEQEKVVNIFTINISQLMKILQHAFGENYCAGAQTHGGRSWDISQH